MTEGKLVDRVAVITGGASGIGGAIAEAFAREGADVALVDQAPRNNAEEVEAAIREHGREPFFSQTDVSSADEVESMAREIIAKFGRVDILVNCAGIFTERRVENMSVEDWDQVLNVNLRGTFLCTRVFINQMLDRGWGRVINIASQLGQIGGIDAAHYSASKAGVIGFTKSLAREVGARGVLVNAIAPGPIETPMLAGETEVWRSRKLQELPIGRFGTVHEVTPTAVLLASDEGSYYLGQTLGPNGGDVML
ncbi:MAG TPA: 3-oxoacyl-ACP reductase family protein [Acidimicrobiales bacterium]|jgi:3-oxoacyl-[acyl-carrier protein] reductase|nr:3-oxoacyl-ACP reductase family protein [Acidimicrobiales bacterium]